MDKSWWVYFIVPFCGAFILMGAGMMVAAGCKIALGARARSWPHTVAQVTSVESKVISDAESGNMREIQVRYSYEVAGREYQGNTIHPSYHGSNIEEPHRALEAILKPAKEVRVYYDPDQPSRSTLAVGFYSSSLRLMGGGFIFFAAGIGFLVAFWSAINGNHNFADGITVIR